MHNSEELHSEHKKWLSDLVEIEDELIIFAKNKSNEFKKDIGSLLISSMIFKQTIQKHESTMTLAFKTSGIKNYDKIFEEHEHIRQNINSLISNVEDLKLLLAKH